jgi:hypothetical protein
MEEREKQAEQKNIQEKGAREKKGNRRTSKCAAHVIGCFMLGSNNSPPSRTLSMIQYENNFLLILSLTISMFILYPISPLCFLHIIIQD